jgi:shikimate 5-dehydrogenase
MKQYGLIGKHLSHSFSPAFFAKFFQKQGIDANYATYELQEIADFQPLMMDAIFGGLNGSVIVRFVVEKDGTVSNAVVETKLRGVSSL